MGASLRFLPAAGVLLVPLVHDPGAFDPYLPLRWSVLGALVGVGLVVVGPTALRGLTRPVALGWAAVTLTAILAAAFAPVPLESWLGDSARRGGVLSLLVVAGGYLVGLGTRSRVDLVLRAAPLAATVVVLVMVAQLPRVGLQTSQSAMVGNPGQLGGYLVLLLGLTLTVAWADPARIWRRAARVVAAGTVPAILLTGSHAAVAGVVALGVCWLVAERRRLPVGARRGLPALLVLLAAVSIAWAQQFREVATSLQGRLDTWQVSFQAIADRPVVGWGPDGFRHGFAQHVPAEFVAAYADERLTDRAHSFLLDHVAATGALGGLALAGLLWAIARQVSLATSYDRGIVWTLAGTATFLLAWFPSVELAVMVALLAGLITRPTGGQAPTRARRRGQAALRDDPPLVTSARGATSGAVVLAGLAFLVAVVGGAAVVEDRRLAAALAAHARGGDGPNPVEVAAGPLHGVTGLLVAVHHVTTTGDPQVLRTSVAVPLDERDAERVLADADLSAALAHAVGEPDRLREAIDAYRRAIQLAPQHSFAWLGLGEALLHLDEPGAEPALRTAARLRPDDVAPRYNLALLGARRGDPPMTRHWLEEACRLDPHDPQVVALHSSLAGHGQLDACLVSSRSPGP